MTTPLHPLHPLTPDEIRRTTELARTAAGARDAVFISVGIRDPDKAAYLAWADAGGPLPQRRGRAAIYDSQRRVREITIDLDASTIVEDRHFPGVQPPITPDEYVAAEHAALHDPLMIEALAKRGITDMGYVQIDVLAAAKMDHPLEEHHRIARAVPYLRGRLGKNGYARPIESLLGIIVAAQKLAGQEPLNGWISVIAYLVFSPAWLAYMQSGVNSVWESMETTPATTPAAAITEAAAHEEVVAAEVVAAEVVAEEVVAEEVVAEEVVAEEVVAEEVVAEEVVADEAPADDTDEAPRA